ncbi:hypothetical protein Vretimale_6503 [Volvox reticuliferus]|uniref:Uncharacterized protein n=1 Tax=Volvox reticuliferus TaxID=1737510 RepID=A0A8J4G7V7_9CHLO|nr:hypothetical protein Vretifemale_19993 [Volvox reticuliferus]GIM01697.1 hypothetical protein Vretimale_6503 [Volvox reticuliferus]
MHSVEPMSAMNGKKKRSRTSMKGQGGDIVQPLPEERAAALKAALDKPISKLDAARCIVHVFNTVFGPVVAKQITGEVSTTLNVPQLDLKAWLPKPREKVQVQRRNKPRTPYMLFLSYAISELYKHKDLPVLKRFLAKHGDHGRIDMQAASQLWKMLPDVDKARLTAWLGPFLNSFNGETKQRFEQRLQEGDTEKHPSGGELRDRYVQYVEAHPEASLIRLLRLDGNTEDLTPPDNLIMGAVRTGNKAAGGATVAGPSTAGPSAMDVDEEVEEEHEEEEEEYQDADEDEGEAAVDADDTDVVVEFSLPEAAGGSAHRISDKSESESESESSTTSSISSESSEVESEEEKQAAPGASSGVRASGAQDEEANKTGGDDSSSSESSGTSESSTSSESEKGDGDGRMSQEEEDTSSSD